MFRIYLKNTWRNLAKQRLTSLINISGLAIGMASAVLIFLWVQNELNFDNYHSDGDRIFRIKNYWTVITKNEKWALENSPYTLGEELQKQIPEVEIATRIEPIISAPIYFNIKGELFKEKKCAYIDENWFHVFHYDFLQGSSATFNQNLFSIVLTESTAKKYFGDDAAIGKIIRIDTVGYQVQAVVKN
jgi:hypothetical protein